MSTNKQVKKIVILGLPNTGKSQVFNNLTKQYNLVSNYPLTTVEIRKVECKIGKETYEIFDTPGLHCLYIHSEEELIVRNMLLDQRPDIIIQCIDANRIKQSLTLTLDLLELGIPMLVSLNAIDETTKKGISIDSDKLSSLLGIPVIKSVAIGSLGASELKGSVQKARSAKWPVLYEKIIEDGISLITSYLPNEIAYKRKLAMLLLLRDPHLESRIEEAFGSNLVSILKKQVEKTHHDFKSNLVWAINKSRSQWIDKIIAKIVKKNILSPEGFSYEFARLSRHPFFGIPILLGIILLMFFSVVNLANFLAEWMNQTFWLPIEGYVDSFAIPIFWNNFLIGDYGLLTFGLSNAILTVLPILSVFFILFNILEDSGYLPNLYVLLKKFSEKFGLTGNAIMPITLGFGCKTMATITTKSLPSKKERYIAIYLIAFALPCAPQMALNMSILGRMGFRAFFIAFAVLVFVEIIAGLMLNRIIKDDKKSDFIQVLPDVRMPSVKAIIKKTYYRLFWFLKEALPIFVYAALVLFCADKIGVLDALKNILRPTITGFLGFPIEMVDVLILCMARHEAAAAMMIKLVQAGQLNYIQCIVAVCLTTMFVPCLANVVAMIKQLGYKVALPMVIIINSTSILIAGLLNWILLFTIHF